jgi:hypothetical protein
VQHEDARWSVHLASRALEAVGLLSISWPRIDGEAIIDFAYDFFSFILCHIFFLFVFISLAKKL